jgi:hypothetical protein
MSRGRKFVLFASIILEMSVAAWCVVVFGRPVARWLVSHGISGTWGRAAFLFLLLVWMCLAYELAIRLSLIGRPQPEPREILKQYGFVFVFSGGLMVWWVIADYVSTVLRSSLPASLSPWILLGVFAVGAVGIALAADRLAPRFGIRTKRKGSNEAAQA